MTALLLAKVGALGFKEWWRDAIVERVAWLWTDLRGSSTSAWDGPTGEWLPAPRRKLGSSK